MYSPRKLFIYFLDTGQTFSDIDFKILSISGLPFEMASFEQKLTNKKKNARIKLAPSKFYNLRFATKIPQVRDPKNKTKF